MKCAMTALLGGVLVLVVSAPAKAQCPSTQPQFSELVNQNPQYLQTCRQLDSGGGCRRPDPPTVVAGSILAQEAVVQAVVPAGFTATSVSWMALHRNSISDPVVQVWEHTSKEGAPHAGGATVRFGAPGLIELDENLFRVGFCDDKGTPSTADDECFCWSAESTPTSTPNFTNGAPVPIATDAQEVEDEFQRPPTSPKNAGDGLGPTSAWADMSARVVDTADADTEGDSAALAQGGAATRMRTSDHEHAYAEVLVRGSRIANPGDIIGASQYNVDVFARSFTVGVQPNTTGKGYYVKLARDPEFSDGDRALAIGRLDGTITYLHTQKLHQITGQPNCPINGPLPLEEADPGDSTRSKPVWVRIEVDDNTALTRARVTAYLAWNCTSGGIETCGQVCKVGPVDDPESFTRGLYSKQGTYGFCSHHKTHFGDLFRAGSTP